jgi:hypothetical protein
MLHRLSRLTLPFLCAALTIGCGEDDPATDSETNSLDTALSFFVTSETHATGDLGGIEGADATCDRLATAAGAGAKTWRAYLSADDGGNGQPVNARQRIGNGPWVNVNGITVAENLDALHARAGDAEVFIDENGEPVNGQWTGSPMPVQHDVLTGSDPQGNVVPGFTCSNWTSAVAATLVEMTSPTTGMPAMVCQSGCAKVGHSDGFGREQSVTPPANSWNSAHDNGGCNDTAPRGGSGRFYCFAAN